MNQQILDAYDEFLTRTTTELTDRFADALANPESSECVVCETQEWLEENKTRFLQELYRVAKPNPEVVRFLLTQLLKQFASYELLALSFMENLDELFPEEDEAVV